MGVSTDGILVYGISFEDGFEFPWSKEGDIEDWWLIVNEFKNPCPNPFDEDGNWKNGIIDNSASDKYFNARREWLENNPMPIEPELHYSYDYPMYIISVSGMKYRSKRGYPTEIPFEEFQELQKSTKDATKTIIDFCEKYEIENNGRCVWYLCSLWG